MVITMTTRKDQPQTIHNEGDPHRYFHQMLNMAEDELDPFQYRLLGHYLRWAGHGGKLPEGIRETAKATKMSISKVRTARAELVKLGYLKVKEPSEEQQKQGKATEITIRDRWQENVERYTPVSNLTHPPVIEMTQGVSEIAHPPVSNLTPLNKQKKEEHKDSAPPKTNTTGTEPVQQVLPKEMQAAIAEHIMEWKNLTEWHWKQLNTKTLAGNLLPLKLTTEEIKHFRRWYFWRYPKAPYTHPSIIVSKIDLMRSDIAAGRFKLNPQNGAKTVVDQATLDALSPTAENYVTTGGKDANAA